MIPGLGLDHRIFNKLHLEIDDVVYLDWFEPEFGESIEHYAGRMAKRIKDPDNSIILGHSFGGMMALKIAEIIHPQLVILVSSAKSKKEVPGLFQVLKWIPLYKAYSNNLRDKTLPYWSYFFGIRSREDQIFFKSMLAKTSNRYREWAIEQLIKFDHDLGDQNVLHIHGCNDRIFPNSKIELNLCIDDADHFMIWKKPDEISNIINTALHPVIVHTG